jgi:dTDP-4-dehydrorhamnose 3,5-epimerase
MLVKPTTIPGCFEIQPKIFRDDRGMFVKTMQQDAFSQFGLECNFVEQFYTVSRPRVIRGLHLQLPPHAHAKLVYCIAGSAVDTVLDLRVGSPTFRHHYMLELSAEKGNMIYIPQGLAHGFCTPETTATMVYCVTSAHAPQDDAGLLWDSAGIGWPLTDPILSERDRNLPPLDAFRSPFHFDRVLA